MIKLGMVQFIQTPSVKAGGNPKKNNYTENSLAVKRMHGGRREFRGVLRAWKPPAFRTVRRELAPPMGDNLSRLDSAHHINVVVGGWKENERQDNLAMSWSAERSRWIKRDFEK
jgi:hypothetical protein